MNKEIKLSFNEIDCIQCAKEIEEEINKINGINKANIDYLNKYIIISYDNEIYNKEEALIDVINNNILVKDEEVEFFNISNNIIDNNKKFNLNKLLFIIGTFIGILAIVFYFLNIFNILNKVLFVIAYILIGYKILIIAIKNIFKGKFFDENFLMTLSSILAISIGDFFEAWGLIFLYRIGEAIQDLAVSKTTNKIASISNLNIDVVMANPTRVPLKIIQPQYHNNTNLCAQKGMFTFWETTKPAMLKESDGKLDFDKKTDRRPLDVMLHEYLKGIHAPAKVYLYRLTLPHDAAHDIYSYIEKTGYNASNIFPGYDGVARFLDEHLRIHRDSGKQTTK